jgi:sugar/nucleoside kinase (ribokinase family)
MMTKNQFDIVTFGSITIDMFLTPGEIKTIPCEGKYGPEECMVFPLGGKIPVESTFQFCGGGSANTAVGFNKLKLKTAVSGAIGNGPKATFLVDLMTKQGVNTDLVMHEEAQSSFSVVFMNPSGERTVFHQKLHSAQYNRKILDTLPETRAMYFGHMSGDGDSILQSLPEWAHAEKTFVGWNPGKTQFKHGFLAYKKVYPVIDVLILNVEEAELFAQKEAKKIPADEALKNMKVLYPYLEKPKEMYDLTTIVTPFLEHGVKTVIVTDGGNGAYGFTKNGKKMFAPSRDIRKPVSTLGAGDAFSVGVVSAALYGKCVEEQMLWGGLNANGTIQRFGAQEGQLTYDMMLQRSDGQLCIPQ